MSFFGALEGLGKGLDDEGEYQQKLGAAREIQADKTSAALQLQREKAQDRADRERDNLLLRAELRAGQGGGKGSGGLNLFQMAMETPPEKQGAMVETVRGFAGDEAANVMARIFGKPMPNRAADPAREDATGYVDATGGMETAVPASVAVPGSLSASEAQKGSVALQRLLGLVAGKSKDQSEGEARNLGTDAVRNATDDAGLRKAGAVNMALEGKDRIGVQGNVEVDKAGVAPSKTTDVGKSMINENNAQAGKASAEAKNERDGTSKGKANTLQSTQVDGNGYLMGVYRDGTVKRMTDENGKPVTAAAFEARVDRAANALQKEGGSKYRRMDPAELRKVARQNLLGEDGALPETPKPAPTKEPVKDTPLPMPASKDKLVTGKTYSTARGPAKWNGAAFEAR